jgi:SAM-dependent methyltransferase
MRSIDEIQALIRSLSVLPSDEREQVIAKRYRALPRRLSHAAVHWPLERSRVLDVGCSYGHCLVHFGAGSVGIDNVSEHVEFCRSLGLDARLVEVERGLDELEDGSFDFVWLSDILEHLDAPRVLLRRLAPKLTPDGRLIVFMTVLPRSRLTRRLFGGRGFFDADVHHYQYSVDTARYLLGGAGYVVEDVVVHLLPRRLEPLSPLLRPFAPQVFLTARADPTAEASALAAEQRNKPGTAVGPDH